MLKKKSKLHSFLSCKHTLQTLPLSLKLPLTLVTSGCEEGFAENDVKAEGA